MAISIVGRIGSALPGLALCAGVTLLAAALERLEVLVSGRAWLESLVLAIVVGACVRALWEPSPRFHPGIRVAGKTLLEVAIVLLGASVGAGAIADTGLGLIGGIAGLVVVAVFGSYGIGRCVGLSHHMAMLVACGNSICGNSAIAAVAPVIGADGNDTAASIGYTAVLGVAVVLLLPLLVPMVGLSPTQYGVLAGLTVYAVPQVLAATVPVAAVSVQIGTLVKLVRVLMLGPVVFVLALVAGRFVRRRVVVHQLVPWFILGFLAMLAMKSFGLIPAVVDGPAAAAAGLFTVASMAAMGLSVDIRAVARAGWRVVTAAVLSLAVLGVGSFGLIHMLNIS